MISDKQLQVYAIILQSLYDLKLDGNFEGYEFSQNQWELYIYKYVTHTDYVTGFALVVKTDGSVVDIGTVLGPDVTYTYDEITSDIDVVNELVQNFIDAE
jgi:hypothetical protein